MAAYTFIYGDVISEPTVQKAGSEEKPIYLVSVQVRSVRYDYVQRKKVGDLFTIQLQGALAKKIFDNIEESNERMLCKGDSIACICENQVYADHTVYFAKELSRLGHEGLEYHFLAGAVESGSHGEIERDDTPEDGAWASLRLRVPKEGYKNPEEVSNRIYNLQAWDKRAETLAKHVIPEENDEETSRKWIVVSGHSKTEKNTFTDKEGEEKTMYKTKTEVGTLEFTRISTEPHKFESKVSEGHASGQISEDEALKIAAAAASGNIPEPDDEEIPF